MSMSEWCVALVLREDIRRTLIRVLVGIILIASEEVCTSVSDLLERWLLKLEAEAPQVRHGDVGVSKKRLDAAGFESHRQQASL